MYLYRALYVVPHTQVSQAWITQCYLQLHQYLFLPRKHSPDGSSPDWGCRHLIAASFIYPKQWKAEYVISNCPVTCGYDSKRWTWRWIKSAARWDKMSSGCCCLSLVNRAPTSHTFYLDLTSANQSLAPLYRIQVNAELLSLVHIVHSIISKSNCFLASVTTVLCKCWMATFC